MSVRTTDTGVPDTPQSDSLEVHQHDVRLWSRRAFLTGTAISLCGLAANPADALGVGESHGKKLGHLRGKQKGHWHGPHNPLRLPSVTSADLRQLTCVPTRVDLGDGQLRRVLTYNGEFPGPTWNARTGDWITVQLVNGLDEPTITHWHGLRPGFANDGGPLLHIHPGESYDYNFQIVRRAGLAFYHPHPHGLTGKQVCLGLAGGLIVRDDEEDALELPSGPYEVPLVIRDASVDSDGNLAYWPTPLGFAGDFPLVNGTLRPRLAVDRGVYRFRVLNGANARIFRLALDNGAPFTIIGNDGGLLEAPVNATPIELGPGERLDLLVDFSSLSRGQSVALRCLSARWNLVQFEGTGVAGMAYTAPQTLSIIPPPLGPLQPTRTFAFQGRSRINGLTYDPNRVDFRVPFGLTERWRFTTAGTGPHPVHVHGALYRMVARNGSSAAVRPWERGWKDTVLLHAWETIDVLIRFEDHRGEYDGQYVMHCHLLEHEDMGMMTNFIVI